MSQGVECYSCLPKTAWPPTCIPVIVSGSTHYRGRGFTNDPDSWVNYFKMLGNILSKPSAYRLSRQQVESAWEYAYRFFFEYPRPFPWHLVRLWDDYKARPLASVLSEEGQKSDRSHVVL